MEKNDRDLRGEEDKKAGKEVAEEEERKKYLEWNKKKWIRKR